MTTLLHDEVGKRHRVTDQMMSAHSMLRDRYARRALVLDLLILTLSAMLCALVFAPQALSDSLGISKAAAGVVAGWVSVGVFVLAILQLRIGWKEAGAVHGNATAVLAETKAQLGMLRRNSAAGVEELSRALDAATLRAQGLAAIPEGLFLELKASHLQKVLLSRVLDRYPFANRTLLRLALAWRHTPGAVRHAEIGE